MNLGTQTTSACSGLAVALLGLALLAPSSPGGSAGTPSGSWLRDPATRERDWQEDIDFLAAELPKRHKNAFFQCKPEDFSGRRGSPAR
jgi:hypothetical protein